MTAVTEALLDRRRRARRVQLLWIAAALLAGCGEGPPPVVIDEPSRHVRLLASEVQAAADPRTLIDSVFVIRNPGSVSADVRLTSVGCGCYGLTLGGRELKVGDQWPVTAGAPAEVRFAVQPSLRAGEMVYEAELEARCDGEFFRLPIRCVVATLADVAITPDVLTHRVGQAGPQAGGYPVHVRRTYRDAATAGVEPTCPGLPGWMRVSEWSCTVAGREAAAGLWIDEWRGTLIVDTPAPRELPVSPVPVSIQFPATGDRAVHGELTLLIERGAGIEAPRELHFGRLRERQSRTRRCVLRSIDSAAFRVTSVESENTIVRVEIDHDEPAAEHWIDVLVSATDSAIERESVRFHTDHPDSPQIEIVLVWQWSGATAGLSD